MSSIITPEQKKVIDSVLSINETGKLPSPNAYSTVTILKDGAGISYGKHQSTDRSGSLDAIVMRYLDLNGTLADKLEPYLDKLNANFSSRVDPANPPADVKALMKLLADAGKDPLMQRAQDEIFDEQYWMPAVNKGVAMKLVLPLTYLALYDTCIHSGPGRIDALRKVFPERPPSSGGDEKAWTVAFLNARFKWLRSNSNPLVQRSADRVTAILKIGTANNWDLVTPFNYRFGVVLP
jgi:chitosanase